MQVQNVGSCQNNFSQKRNPNFTSIRSLSCEGLYKKYPEYAKKLVDKIQENQNAMAFFDNYDVDIVFHAVKQVQDSVESSVHVFFDNIAKSKTRKFFEKLIGISNDKVVIHAWGNKYSLPQSLEESTLNLIEDISPERKVAGVFRGGLLDSHLESVDEKIKIVLKEKAKKALERAELAQATKESKNRFEAERSELQKSIDELMKKGS